MILLRLYVLFLPTDLVWLLMCSPSVAAGLSLGPQLVGTNRSAAHPWEDVGECEGEEG